MYVGCACLCASSCLCTRGVGVYVSILVWVLEKDEPAWGDLHFHECRHWLDLKRYAQGVMLQISPTTARLLTLEQH